MDTSWESLNKVIKSELALGIKSFGYTNMTPVQASCIPLMINYKDVAVEAITGSGKTLAFLVPTLQILLRREDAWKKHEVGAIIIAPTRELAFQIQEVLSLLLKEIYLTNLLFIGGTPISDDVESFNKNGGNIIIATPGRLEDLLLRKEESRLASGIKYLEVLILDEADCLLNLGFEESINTILRMLPKQRRTGLFSATQTTEVLKLVRAGLRNPVSVVVRENDEKRRVPCSLENFYCIIEPELKFNLLLQFIKRNQDKKILVFFSTCACVEYFAYVLENLLKESNVMLIHGKMKEKARFAIFDKFRNSNTGVLLCTDIMARGIDITKKIDWVVQFDPPSNASSFIHRAGRTARNGDEGKALLFLMPSETNYTSFIQINQKVTLDEFDIEDYKKDLNPSVVLQKIRKLQLKDRGVYDKAMRAFVSYFKAYSKYECYLILRTKDLKLGHIASTFGLIKFPKISELPKNSPEGFEEFVTDLNAIPYKDKQKEASRKRKLDEFEETGKWPEPKGIKRRSIAEPWSIKKNKKLKKKEKKAKKVKKKDTLTQDEFDDLDKDFKLLKKLKKGKISEADYDKTMGLDEIEDDPNL